MPKDHQKKSNAAKGTRSTNSTSFMNHFELTPSEVNLSSSSSFQLTGAPSHRKNRGRAGWVMSNDANVTTPAINDQRRAGPGTCGSTHIGEPVFQCSLLRCACFPGFGMEMLLLGRMCLKQLAVGSFFVQMFFGVFCGSLFASMKGGVGRIFLKRHKTSLRAEAVSVLSFGRDVLPSRTRLCRASQVFVFKRICC